MISLSIILVFKCLFSSDGIGDWHVVFLDGLPSSIPILSAFGLPVLFYCHFPDKYNDYYDNLIFKLHLIFFIPLKHRLLSPINLKPQTGGFSRLYRNLIDWLEDYSIEQSSLIAGN